MIRPITCVTFLLACASGLYLYQSKHRVHVLDAQIEQIVHQTEQVRAQTRVLHAEWTLLDQPDRLQQLAGQFLALQPTKPTQFSSLADLDSRLPPPLPPQTTPADIPAIAEEAPAATTPAATTQVASAASAEPSAPAHGDDAKPATPTAPVRTSRSPEHMPPARTMLASTRAPAAEVPARPARPRFTPAASPRPLPVYRPQFQPAYQRPSSPVMQAAAPAVYGGSMLGMARGAAPPPPAPAPVWADWNR